MSIRRKKTNDSVQDNENKVVPKERKIVLNSIRTPDGTILISFHRHDFLIHKDANGTSYFVDGGRDYIRRGGNFDYEELSIYDDASIEVIRKSFYRPYTTKDAYYRKTIDAPFIKTDTDNNKYIRLDGICDNWLNGIIAWCNGMKADASIYEREREYRKANGLVVE